jgi:hypothetical protein
MKQTIWKLSFGLCILLLSPVAFAQERQAGPSEKVVLVRLGKSDQRKKTTGLTKITFPTDAAKPAETEGTVEAKARPSGENIILVFSAPFPNKSLKLSLDSDLPLDDGAGCAARKGIYSIDYSQVTNGSVSLPVVFSDALMVDMHRRRPSRRRGVADCFTFRPRN